HGNIGIEVLAKDKFRPKDSFYGGVNYIDMSVNDRPHFRQSIDQIDFNETRRIHALMNYRTLQRTGKRFYKLYIDDGNTLPYYKGSPSDGKLRINEEEDMKVEVKLMDTFSNSSKLKLTLRPSPPVKEVKNLSPAGEYPSGEVLGNVLRLTSKPMPDPDQKASLYTVDSVIQMAPTYRNETNTVYLIDLRKVMPDSVVVNDKTYVTHFRSQIPPDTEYKYYSDRLNITFPANALYDTLYLTASFRSDPENNTEIFSLGDSNIPLLTRVSIDYKPEKFFLRSKQIGIYRIAGKGRVYLGGAFSNGRISFQTRDFGEFTILTD